MWTNFLIMLSWWTADFDNGGSLSYIKHKYDTVQCAVLIQHIKLHKEDRIEKTRRGREKAEGWKTKGGEGEEEQREGSTKHHHIVNKQQDDHCKQMYIIRNTLCLKNVHMFGLP